MSEETINAPVTESDVSGHGLHTDVQHIQTDVAVNDVDGHGWNHVRNQVPNFDVSDEDESEEIEGHRMQNELRATEDDSSEGVEGHRMQNELRAIDHDDDDDVEGHRLHHGHH